MAPHPNPPTGSLSSTPRNKNSGTSPELGVFFVFSIEFYMTVNKVNLRIWKVAHIQSGDHVWLLGRLVQHRECYGGRKHPIRGPPVQVEKGRRNGLTHTTSAKAHQFTAEPFMLWAFRLPPHRVHFQDSLLLLPLSLVCFLRNRGRVRGKETQLFD